MVSVGVNSKFLSMTYPAILEHPSSVDWKNQHSCDLFKTVSKVINFEARRPSSFIAFGEIGWVLLCHIKFTWSPRKAL